MTFYEDIYYRLSENERETFFNSLPKNEKEKLAFIINRNNALESIDDEQQKEYFKNIYNNIPDEDKNSFLSVFNTISKSKRNEILKIFETINDCKINYSYSMSKSNIKDIVPSRKNDIDSIMENIKDNESEFYRIIYIAISSKVIEILNSFGHINISNQANDFFGKYDYNFDNYYKTKELNSKFLEVLFNIPEDKKEYFFNQFENTDELRDVSFIKILRNMLNTNKEAFLEIFRNNMDNQNIDLNNKSGTSFAWINTESGIGFIFPNNTSIVNTLWMNSSSSGKNNLIFLKEAKDIETFFLNKSGMNSEIREFLTNGCQGLRMMVLFGGQIISIIASLYNQLENIERFVLNRIFDIIMKLEVNNVLDAIQHVNTKNIKDFISLSKSVNIYNMNHYLDLFNNNFDKINSSDLHEEIVTIYVQKCKDKLTEILCIIEDFEHAVKEDYKKSCEEIASILDSGIENKYKFNKIIEHINNIYKNAYYKKHNKSSLAFRMDDEDDNIKYIEYIN